MVLAAEVGGRWSDECQQFFRTLLRLRVQGAPPPLRASAAQGWARRWWSVLSVALQRAVASSGLGVWTMPPLPGTPDALPLGDVLDLAIASAPNRLPRLGSFRRWDTLCGRKKGKNIYMHNGNFSHVTQTDNFCIRCSGF